MITIIHVSQQRLPPGFLFSAENNFNNNSSLPIPGKEMTERQIEKERETKRKRERRQALAFLLPIVSFALKADNTHSEQNENKKAFSYFFVFGSILSNKRILVKKSFGRIL